METTKGPATVFAGRIGPDLSTSVPWWPKAPRPPGRAPNIVMVVLDDVGFAQLACYGGDIATPALDTLAHGGVRYRNFHTTALCSPTRACLLTGRNHHAVGMGLVANFDNGFPGYRGYVAHEAATIAELLRDAGYATYCTGKWHLVPPRHTGPTGPFDHWPLGRGFDHFYGFLHGKTNQWVPTLWQDNHSIAAPATPGYHLTEDLVDRALGYLNGHLAANTDRPFFLYLALGACHDPHHAPADFIERYAGAFDDGWDAARERVLARQVETECVPEGTQLAPPNPGVPAWAELSAEEQRLFARMQEVFAGFLTHADEHVGRLVSFLDAHALLDNTLVIALSDNGASMEGGRYGYVNPPFRAGRFPTLAENLAQLPLLGGPLADNHYPAGWAQAGNTPLKYYKMYAHGGGIRAPLIMHWPARIAETGGWRGQYHHAVDVVPTILDELGLSVPTHYHGAPQMPLHGTSMAYTFDDPTAPTRKHQQYYEIHGHRGLWHDGWKAVTCHQPRRPFSADRWELYHTDADFSEADDLAGAHPDKLADLVARWWADAGRYGVLPLEDRTVTITGNPAAEPRADATTFTYLPGAFLPDAASCPDVFNRDFHLSATVDYSPGDEGILLAFGDHLSGFSLFVQAGRLVFDYNASGTHSVVATDKLQAGASLLEVDVRALSPGTAHARLAVDGRSSAEATITPTILSGVNMTGIQCGHGRLLPVSDSYANPFTYTGHLTRVTVALGPKEPGADDLAFNTVMRDQ